MNKAELEQLTKHWVRDAKVLLAARRWGCAYYAAGYAVECALKACVIARLKKSDEFPDRKFSEQCWTHNLTQLLKLAGLDAALTAAAAADAELLKHWDIVKDWNEATRYLRKPRPDALALYHALTDKKHGVLPWIRSHW